jgi:hypothetical protein
MNNSSNSVDSIGHADRQICKSQFTNFGCNKVNELNVSIGSADRVPVGDSMNLSSVSIGSADRVPVGDSMDVSIGSADRQILPLDNTPNLELNPYLIPFQLYPGNSMPCGKIYISETEKFNSTEDTTNNLSMSSDLQTVLSKTDSSISNFLVPPILKRSSAMDDITCKSTNSDTCTLSCSLDSEVMCGECKNKLFDQSMDNFIDIDKFEEKYNTPPSNDRSSEWNGATDTPPSNDQPSSNKHPRSSNWTDFKYGFHFLGGPKKADFEMPSRADLKENADNVNIPLLNKYELFNIFGLPKNYVDELSNYDYVKLKEYIRSKLDKKSQVIAERNKSRDRVYVDSAADIIYSHEDLYYTFLILQKMYNSPTVSLVKCDHANDSFSCWCLHLAKDVSPFSPDYSNMTNGEFNLTEKPKIPHISYFNLDEFWTFHRAQYEKFLDEEAEKIRQSYLRRTEYELNQEQINALFNKKECDTVLHLQFIRDNISPHTLTKKEICDGIWEPSNTCNQNINHLADVVFGCPWAYLKFIQLKKYYSRVEVWYYSDHYGPDNDYCNYKILMKGLYIPSVESSNTEKEFLDMLSKDPFINETWCSDGDKKDYNNLKAGYKANQRILKGKPLRSNRNEHDD